MKRNTAILMAVAFVMTVLITSFSGASLASNVSIQSFNAKTPYCLVETVGNIAFEASLAGNYAGSVAVKDQMGTQVAVLYDNGRNGDEIAGDGIFYGVASLSSDQIGNKDYTISVSSETAETSVRFYKNLTAADWTAHDATYEKVFAIEDDGEKTKDSDDKILNDVYSYLVTDENVAKVWYENDSIINFELTSGIGCIYNRFSEGEKGGSSSNADSFTANATKSAADFILSGDIGVWCPYYGQDSNFTYNYLERANTLPPVTGGTVTSYYGAAANVESFKTWGQFGVIMVDSHGTTYSGKSCICVPIAGAYDNADIAQGHLYSMGGGGVAITGTFFSKYIPSLPQSCIYIGTCYGLMTPALWQPLLDINAGMVVGFTESVSFLFDGEIIDSFWGYLANINPATNDYYTTAEAWAASRADNGAIDPYSSYGAEFVKHGNDNLRILATPIAVETFDLTPNTTDLYLNNTFALTPVVSPDNANRYSLAFTSANEAIATVDNHGIVTATGLGSTTITCLLTDNFNETTPQTFTDTVAINVVGSMPVSGITLSPEMFETFLGAEGTKLEITVLPENASNQNVLWSSSNEAVATVADGVVTATGGGEATITVTTVDGGFTATSQVLVRTLNEALNIENGTLEFVNNVAHPWFMDNADNRISAKSTIEGLSSTNSAITLSIANLPIGSTLSFDWKVDSENNYDKLKFAVNGATVNGIADISGNVGWTTKTYTITQNRNFVFTWTYAKDVSVNRGADCGWVDNVALTIPGSPTPVPPTPTPVPPTPTPVPPTPTPVPPTPTPVPPTPTPVPPTPTSVLPTPTSNPVLIGDANLDGVINTGDVASILSYMVGFVQYNDNQMQNADVNANGRVDTGDAAMLLCFVITAD
ncbi:MAG: Ig-like domain-containing protein [Clostridia bacterium]